MSQTIERPETRQHETTGNGDSTPVIVMNDSHNTFEGVMIYFCKIIPKMNPEKAFKLALQIHNEGQAVVWSGHKEIAELYWEQLRDCGLTMGPI